MTGRRLNKQMLNQHHKFASNISSHVCLVSNKIDELSLLLIAIIEPNIGIEYIFTGGLNSRENDQSYL